MKNKMLDLLNEEKMYALLLCKDSTILSDSAEYMITDKESLEYMIDTYTAENDLKREEIYVRPVELTHEITMYRCYACVDTRAFIYKEEAYDTYCLYNQDVDFDYLIDTLTLNCLQKEESSRLVLSCFLKVID